MSLTFRLTRVSSGYFGRVNNTNTVINNTTINNYYNDSRNPNNTAIANIRYANQSVPNAVMAVPQDRFANGHRVAESARAVSASPACVRAPSPPLRRSRRSGPAFWALGQQRRPALHARPPIVLSRPVVARTAPPPAPVPFDRQQAALNQNPGRPLPAATVQQIRQNAPARSCSGSRRGYGQGPAQFNRRLALDRNRARARRIPPRDLIRRSKVQPANAQQRPSPAAPPAANNPAE